MPVKKQPKEIKETGKKAPPAKGKEPKESKDAKEAKKARKEKYWESVGRRKTSIARVRLMKGGGLFVINDQALDKYFSSPMHQNVARAPFVAVREEKAFDVSVQVCGGGISGQAVAVRHGIARALVLINEEHRKRLKREGFLKRDPRAKERRKFGLKKARKSAQWSKR